MSWDAYFLKTEKRKLRPLFLKSLDFIDKQKPLGNLVIDLGCGTGIETQEFAKRGWQALAIDGQKTSIERIQDIIRAFPELSIETKWQDFEDILDLPLADIIYSYHSLPFCRQNRFDHLLQTVFTSIKPQGYFVGSFFGFDDAWVKSGQCSGMSKADLEKYLTGFDILHFHEYQKQEAPALENDLKNWHVFEVIVRKNQT